jgi:DNA polymerase III epsilon subunit-like protein
MRYLAIDFETNGRPNDYVLPCGAFPTQVSVTAFVPASGEIVHLHDSLIHGAQSLTDWVIQNTPVTLERLQNAPPAKKISATLAELWREGDIIVAHNSSFDLGCVLPKIASWDHPFLTGPRSCTMREPWVRLLCGKLPALSDLCSRLGVSFVAADAHNATYDTFALARCLKEAHLRRHTWSVKVPVVVAPKAPEGSERLRFGKYSGQTFEWVWRHDRSYCDWFLGEQAAIRTGQPARFGEWLQAELQPPLPRLCRAFEKALY